jgi:hypothetical protein
MLLTTLIWIAALSWVVAAAAQSEGPSATGPGGLVLPLPNAPFSARQVEELTRTGPDSSANNVVESRVYRDAIGGTRIEWRVLDTRAAFEVVYRIDPVSSSVTMMLPGSKLACRTSVAQSRPGGFHVAQPGGWRTASSGKWQMKTESLGTRMMEGVEVHGTRTTPTLKSEPSLTAVWEEWSSSALGIKMLVEASFPNWSAKLQDLDRNEPDPALFVIPPEYSVRD